MKQWLFILFFSFSSGYIQAQVGINTTTPNPNAVLDVHSAFAGGGYGGFMPPKVTLAQRNSIVTTAADDGLLVYVSFPSGNRCLQLFNGATLVWEDLKCFDGPPSVTQLRIFGDYVNNQPQYTFSSGDILYRNINLENFTTGSTSGVCSGAVNRVQYSSIILHLISSSTSQIVVHGTSSGTGRTLTNIETSTTLNGTYTSVPGFTSTSTINSAACGIITISNISIPANTFIRFTFSGNINLSGFDIISP
ncbi:MAG: hypothetical protein Q8K02_12820 [Flavobacterium sp.]|nr:hypothetical protein [Flavobacterium sp.]